MYNSHHSHKPKVLQTQVCPRVDSVRQMNCDYVVPVVHPKHTTNVVNHNYEFQHSFPQTESRVDRINNRQVLAGPPPGQVMGASQPGPGPGAPGPGQVMGAFQPGPGQVMGANQPGQVMGANQPAPGQVMGAHHPCPRPGRGLFGRR